MAWTNNDDVRWGPGDTELTAGRGNLAILAILLASAMAATLGVAAPTMR